MHSKRTRFEYVQKGLDLNAFKKDQIWICSNQHWRSDHLSRSCYALLLVHRQVWGDSQHRIKFSIHDLCRFQEASARPFESCQNRLNVSRLWLKLKTWPRRRGSALAPRVPCGAKTLNSFTLSLFISPTMRAQSTSGSVAGPCGAYSCSVPRQISYLPDVMNRYPSVGYGRNVRLLDMVEMYDSCIFGLHPTVGYGRNIQQLCIAEMYNWRISAHNARQICYWRITKGGVDAVWYRYPSRLFYFYFHLLCLGGVRSSCPCLL